MNYKFTNRNLHRDFAHFYFGLIIAFSLSGIVLNHRQDWYPMDYTFEQKEIQLDSDFDTSILEDPEATKAWALSLNPEGKFDGKRLNGEKLRVYYKPSAIADIDLSTGKGTLEFKRKVPLLGHSMYLHKTTNASWVWYSDIFGAAMLLIAITGVMIPLGKNGFKQRGWKLALAGMIFPLIFLMFLS